MEVDYDKLWEDIFAVLNKSENKLPHEKSLLELAAQFNYGKTKMKREVDRLIEAGLLTSRMCKSKNGKECLAYAPTVLQTPEHSTTETSKEK